LRHHPIDESPQAGDGSLTDLKTLHAGPSCGRCTSVYTPLILDPFAIILLAAFAALVLWILVLAKFSGRGLEQVDWKSPREVTESRDALEAEDLTQMLEAHNARRRRRGEGEVTVEELEVRVLQEANEQNHLREKYLAGLELDELLEATNKRRRARGLPERTRSDVQREFGG
jgi:hypothetical protein